MPKTIVNLASNNDLSSLLRQTPQGDGIWGSFKFEFGNSQGQDDWLIAIDEPRRDFRTKLPKSRRILFRTEPQSIKYYSPDYLNQFGTVVAIDSNLAFRGHTIISQLGLPWMYGLNFSNPDTSLQWNELLVTSDHSLKGELSVVCSTKNMNINQSRRIRFLNLLKDALGNRLTIYGRGFQPISDKKEAIDGYRYHLVLENNLLPHGWTEKLADPILGGVFPISAGSPNLSDYFNPNGFSCIDITKPKQAVAQVLRILNEDPASNAQEAMKENKHRLLFENNLFPLCCRVIEEAHKHQGSSELKYLDNSLSFIPNVKPKWKKLLAIPRPLRPLSRRLYLSMTERQ